MNKRDEAILLSYPKCGRTWLRYLIGSYLCYSRGYNGLHLPEVEKNLVSAGLIPLEFSHASSSAREKTPAKEYSFFHSQFEGKKIIFLYREIKDTLVSYYFQTTLRADAIPMGTPISLFLEDERVGLKKILSFYKQAEKYLNERDDVLYLAYEEMHSSPHSSLEHVIDFLGENPWHQEAVALAVENASFEKMHWHEQHGTYRNSSGLLVPGQAGGFDTNGQEHAMPESFKTRRGKVDGYKDYFSQEICEMIDEAVKESEINLLKRYYE